MKWRRTKKLRTLSTIFSLVLDFFYFFLCKQKKTRKKILKSVSQNIRSGKHNRRKVKDEGKKQIHLKSFVIKSKLTFRAKLCYPPNLHFSLTNTKKKKQKTEK